MMVEFTDSARSMVLRFAQAMDDPKVRISVHGSPFAPEYQFALVEDPPGSGDRLVGFDGFGVLIDEGSVARIDGSVVDWVENENGTGFQVRNPNVRQLGASEPTGELAERVKGVLESRVNPAVASHGGEITLVDVADRDVFIELGGGCQGCGMARVTLKQGVEKMLREAVPDLGQIVDVTDHAAGTDPYYAAT